MPGLAALSGWRGVTDLCYLLHVGRVARACGEAARVRARMSAAGSGERLAVGMVETPLGPVWIAATERGIAAVTPPGGTRAACLRDASRRRSIAGVVEGGDLVDWAVREIGAYFAGSLRAFGVPLDLAGTPFQRAVWEAVRGIPYGETATYGALAARLGRPGAARAVGAANGANPASIVVPCHRVVGSDGGLRGYGGGLEVKAALLARERGAPA